MRIGFCVPSESCSLGSIGWFHNRSFALLCCNDVCLQQAAIEYCLVLIPVQWESSDHSNILQEPAGYSALHLDPTKKKAVGGRERKKAARTHSTCVVLQWSNEFYSSSTNFSWWQVWMPHAKKFAKSSSVSIQCWSFLRSNQHFYHNFQSELNIQKNPIQMVRLSSFYRMVVHK